MALDVLRPLASIDPGELKYYRFTRGEVASRPAIIARTGYTGEDGFELYVAPDHAAEVWRAVLAQGASSGVVPAGLGARDTLRFEAGMCLYGNDIDETTTPLEAGLGWIVKLAKGDFIGRDVLERQAEEGVEQRLVGLEILDRGIARHGYDVFESVDATEACGRVTSGTRSPTLDRPLAMAYVPSEASEPGREFFVQIRDRRVRAGVVELPFYSRKKT
jgi:aminomethyltransferase